MRLLNRSSETVPSQARLTLNLASTPEEVREVQRLRYKVFVEKMGLSALMSSDGLDRQGNCAMNIPP